MSDAAVLELARRADIAVEWTDYSSQVRRVPLDTVRRILEALGLPCRSAQDLADSRQKLQRPPIPPLITATEGRPIDLPLPAVDAPKRARLIEEDGSVSDLPIHRSARGLRLSQLKARGYHTLELGEYRVTIATAPHRCTTIADIAPGQRLWGLVAQIYGLRSPGDCGIGDTAGVANLARAAAAEEADVLALSPAHALFTADPSHYSPYSPSSRLFYNPLYADPTPLFGFARVAEARAAAGLHAADDPSALIDWQNAARTKLAIFRRLFEDFATSELSKPGASGLAADFAKFRAVGGKALAQHALFESLHSARVREDPRCWGWPSWPAQWRDPAGGAVAQFAEKHSQEVTFHAFLQWIADRAFAAAHSQSVRSGMRVGLLADLAVGLNGSGSQAWANQEDMLRGLEIGAPPDLFNANGQNWGLTAFSPRALSSGGFHNFTATLRASMRNAGGLRIDHAMGLLRLWVIPRGANAGDGAYLSYPLVDLLRLTALESYRHRAIVVGEDLGTVPEGFRARLARAGIYGMSVLWFERTQTGFLSPEKWPSDTVAMTSTHDLPTVAGWWRGSDLATRAHDGLLVTDQRREQMERAKDREVLWTAFKSARVDDGELPSPAEDQRIADDAVKYIAPTPAHLALLPLEDALATIEQPNLPGTIDQHPNWRRRYSGDATGLLDAPRVRNRLAPLKSRNPR